MMQTVWNAILELSWTSVRCGRHSDPAFAVAMTRSVGRACEGWRRREWDRHNQSNPVHGGHNVHGGASWDGCQSGGEAGRLFDASSKGFDWLASGRKADASETWPSGGGRRTGPDPPTDGDHAGVPSWAREGTVRTAPCGCHDVGRDVAPSSGPGKVAPPFHQGDRQGGPVGGPVGGAAAECASAAVVPCTADTVPGSYHDDAAARESPGSWRNG